MSIEERLQHLEDDRAIRDLKSRYLRACDSQAPDEVRDTLLPDARIEYEGFPPFDNRDAFVEIYRQFGCAPGIHDIHHGANGIVTFDGPDSASGQWSLTFHNVNLAQRTITQFGVEYEDRYVRQKGRWWIAETRSRRKSVVIESVDAEGRPVVVAMGAAPDTLGEG